MCMFCEFEDTNARKIVVYGNETIYSERSIDTMAYFVLAHSKMLNNQTQLVCKKDDVFGFSELMTIFYCPMCGREL